MQNKIALIILDGWGLNKEYPGNAITLANTPTFDRLWQEYPSAVLKADGESVGLPEGQMGTSEVNHFTIGAGKIVFQNLVRINKAINNESFFSNEALLKACQHAKKHNSALHLIGMISDGGVHSHQEHTYALLRMAKDQGVKKVYIHLITDGRDSLDHNSIKYAAELQDKIDEIGVGKIKSVIGRHFAMDRDKNWDRTNSAFNLFTKAEGALYNSVLEAITESYDRDLFDQYIEASWIDGKEEGTVNKNDAIIFSNFRDDRMRQIVRRFIESSPKNVHLTCMVKYHPAYNIPVAFENVSVDTTLGKIISENNLTQLRVTETEKFAHLTFFLNCKVEEPYEGEDRIMLDSYSDIKTHDERPEMRAADIAEEIVQDMKTQKHDVIFANICNADMVGHTGNIEAAMKGCQAVDQALDRIVTTALENDYDLLITADHGNADEMLDEETGDIITCHSLHPVPLILVSEKYKQLQRENGLLVDLAPTILTMLDLPIPDDMTGESFV